MVRTELRRTYFDLQRTETISEYTGSGVGAYNYIFYDISKETSEEMASEDIVEKSAYYYTSGYMGTSENRYTVGCYPDKTSFDMTASQLIEGKLPSNSGEITISEAVLEDLGLSSEIGDTITLTSYSDKETESGNEKSLTLVGIIEDDRGKSTRETSMYSNGSYLEDFSYHEPVILLSSSDIDTENAVISQMVCMKNGTRLSKTVQDLNKESTEINEQDEFILKYIDKTGSYNIGGYDSSYFTAIPNLNEDCNGYLKSAKSNFYSYTAIAAGFLMAVTLCCCLVVILQEKIKSMRLLQRIGYSVARLRRMLIMEGFIFTLFGTLLGFAVAVGLYEILLQIQYHFFGLEICRAYVSEWGIKQITYSPVLISVIAVCAVAVLSYAIPIIRMKSMLGNNDKKRNHGFLWVHSLSGSIRKIFFQPLTYILQAISLTLVITISCTALMFFSTSGKSSNQNPQLLTQGKFYKTTFGLDQKTYDIDCVIENQKIDVVMGLRALEVDSGFSADQSDSLEESGLFSSCYSWIDLDNVFFAYPQGTEVNSDLVFCDEAEYGAREAYGLTGYDVYDVSSALHLNDSMMNEIISSYSRNLSSVADMAEDEVIVLSLDGNARFEVGETLPLFTAYGPQKSIADSLEDSIEYAEKFEVKVADNINIDINTNNTNNTDNTEESESLLYEILSHYSSDYIVLFPTSTVQNFTLPYQNYDYVYLKYNENITDEEVKTLIDSVDTATSYMKTKTITDCTNNYKASMLKEYIIAFTVFGLMIILSLIGYFQTLRLQIYQKSSSIRNLRAIGMSKKSLCLFMYKQFIKIPVLSGFLSIASVYGVRRFLKWRYDICSGLYESAMNYPDQESEEFINLYTQFAEQQERFLTAYEMYKVPIFRFLVILFIILFIYISVYIYNSSKKAASMSIIEKTEGER